MLTFAYTTCRKEPKVEWFLDSLQRELGGSLGFERIIVVDFWKGKINRPWGDRVIHVSPKPTVWAGDYRLTSRDYFSQCSSRNTALCCAPDGHIVFADDLSVLLPGWLNSVREAMAGGYIACGAYKKVKNLVVENGEVKSFSEHPAGNDTRNGRHDRAVDCKGRWAYGCSIAMPVEAALTVGGYPEALCDGCGYEDVIMGKLLENAGFKFKYDLRMMTYESEELHAQLPVMHRDDPCKGSLNANPRDDQSHAMLRAVENLKFHPNYFGEDGIRGLRNKILAGGEFPIMKVPEHRWFDGKPLREL